MYSDGGSGDAPTILVGLVGAVVTFVIGWYYGSTRSTWLRAGRDLAGARRDLRAAKSRWWAALWRHVDASAVVVAAVVAVVVLVGMGSA